MWFWELNLGPLREQPVLLTFKPSLQPQKHSFHCIDVLWSICSSHLEGRVHYFRITNQFSHSLNYSGNFFELFVEILKLWNCHLDGLAAYLARVICHLQHHCHVRILERSAAVRAHSHAQFPLKTEARTPEPSKLPVPAAQQEAGIAIEVALAGAAGSRRRSTQPW